MNKYQEAFDYIVCATNRAEGVTSQMLVLEELVKKATPKKTKLIKHLYDVNDMYINTEGKCPICQKWVSHKADDRYGYCQYCGQKLDWSEEE